ncbi:MAG: MobA/MobL family protein, partial [Sedimenticola sp.]
MAIFSASVSKVQRAKGQSATAAAAYQLRTVIDDPKTGERHDYRRAGGIIGRGATVPPGATQWADPSVLAVLEEQSENRKNSTVARRAIIALPHELNNEERLALASAISQAVTDQWGVGCGWAAHPP